jgi:hypothetical protein
MTLDPHAIHAVVEGEHGDPFAVLGPHQVQTPDGAAVAVRAIVPGAKDLAILVRSPRLECAVSGAVSAPLYTGSRTLVMAESCDGQVTRRRRPRGMMRGDQIPEALRGFSVWVIGTWSRGSCGASAKSILAGFLAR